MARWAFDHQMRVIQDEHPRPLDEDVVLIGIAEGTYSTFDEPFALWHRHYGLMLRALARARPRAIALDTVLPERSYDFILKGSDIALMQGLALLKNAPASVRLRPDAHRQREVRADPAEPGQLPHARQFRPGSTDTRRGPDLPAISPGRALDEKGKPVPTLASQVLRQLKIPVREGFIDYSLGAPRLRADASHRADAGQGGIAGRRAAQALRQSHRFRGERDRRAGPLEAPTQLYARPTREPASGLNIKPDPYVQPGVLIHAQIVRNHLATGTLHPIAKTLHYIAMAIAATAVFISASPVVVIGAAIIGPILLLGAGIASIVSAQVILPLASIIITFWMALLVRGLFDAIEAVVERFRLQQSFSGQVSPAVMKEMLGGALSPGISGQLAEVCILFSDVRDFTTLSERMPPDVVTTVLQRYFDRMVHAVHRYDGTVDKFIGDGMMVLFGAPRKSRDPCGEAVQCALAMMKALDSLNEEFQREGLPTLTIGIGINYGTVTVGNIGSSERHNYSAIGDAVNVAARVEGLTKDPRSGKIIITEAVVSRIEERFHFDPLGTHKVKGHSPVNVWGIRTARSAPSLADTMEVVR